MAFKDYYAALGVPATATQDEIKRAYRRAARRFHPDVSQDPDAEARFKEVAEAHEALIDGERRAAYDEVARRHASGQAFETDPTRDNGFEFSGRGRPANTPEGDAAFSDFFESLFGRRTPGGGSPATDAPGRDHHARLEIDLMEAFDGARRTVSLLRPVVDAQGGSRLQPHLLEVDIPRGVRDGQSLRLAGQGAAGLGDAPPGDLFLEVHIRPHADYRLEGCDLHVDLPVAPWEAALGADIMLPTPGGPLLLSVPAGSVQGRRLRLKGRGLPGARPGDLYAVLTLVLPPAASGAQQQAYQALAQAFPGFDPRPSSKA